MPDADLHIYVDPVCPFAWMTSRWVEQVAAQRHYDVEYRFISLRIVNESVDYDSRFPPNYLEGHTAGLQLLRVAAAAREADGPPAVRALYGALGDSIWNSPREPGSESFLPGETRDVALAALDRIGASPALADAVDDDRHDEVIRSETSHALSLTGKDVGTPILQFEPPDGVAFFGPVISRLPSDDEAVELWDHVIGLARFPSFAELKRSLRELPQLRALGVDADHVGRTEDWHGGSRRKRGDAAG